MSSYSISVYLCSWKCFIIISLYFSFAWSQEPPFFSTMFILVWVRVMLKLYIWILCRILREVFSIWYNVIILLRVSMKSRSYCGILWMKSLLCPILMSNKFTSRTKSMIWTFTSNRTWKWWGMNPSKYWGSMRGI